MPSNFNKPIATISAPQNDARPYVSTESTLSHVLPGLVQNVNVLADAYVVNKYTKTAGAGDYQGRTQAEYEAEAADVRAAINQAAVQKDSAAVDEFTKKYAAVIKAERQGAIDATNASIRQETLLKQYVNRFPHLDSKFRSVYSSTRAVNEANKFGNVSDPFEEGVNDAVKAAAAQGVPVSEIFRQRQTEAAANTAKQKAALGENIYSTVAGIVDQAARGAMDVAFSVVSRIANAQQPNIGRVDGALLSAELEQAKQKWKYENMHSIIQGATERADPTKLGAILTPDQYKDMEKKLDQAWDAAASYAKTRDTAELLQKDNEYRRQLREQLHLNIDDDLDRIYPALSYLIARNPEAGTAAFGKVWQVMKMNESKQMEALIGLRELADRAGNTTEVIQYDVGMAMLRYFDTAQSMQAAQNFLNGSADELPSYGNAYVDAAMDERALSLANSTMTQADGARVATGALKKEQSTLGTMGVHWITNPTFSQQLKNPAFHKEVDQTTASMSVTALREVDDAKASSISFDTDYNKEGSSSTPWKAYSSATRGGIGGPFKTTSKNPQSLSSVADANNKSTAQPTKEEAAVDTLNNLYWIKRTQYGAARAAAWANEIMVQLDKKAEPNPQAKGTIDRSGAAK